MDALLQMFREMSPVKILAMAGTAVVLLGFFVFLATRVDTQNMGLLYSGLSMEDSAQIIGELEKAGVPFQLDAGGAVIRVPADSALKLRMRMAQEGLPSSDVVG